MFDVTVVNRLNIRTNQYISGMNGAERRVNPVESDSSFIFVDKLLL